MAELIPPRRDEALTDGNGIPTLRHSVYLEGLAQDVNINTSGNEVVNSVASASPAQLASVIKQLSDLELQTENTAMLAAIIKRLSNIELQADSNGAAALSQVFKRLNDIELQTDNTAMLARVFKRLNDLETTQAASDAVGVNTAIESTFDRRYALLVS